MKKQTDVNDRKHLTAAEVDTLMAATKGRRKGARDRCLLLLMFRHGLRVSEDCGLELSQVDTESRVLHVVRLKKGLSATHPLRPDRQGIARDPREDEAGDRRFLCQRANSAKYSRSISAVRKASWPLTRISCWLPVLRTGPPASSSCASYPTTISISGLAGLSS